MTQTAVCPRCNQPDLVRAETVVKAAYSVRACYCARCRSCGTWPWTRGREKVVSRDERLHAVSPHLRTDRASRLHDYVFNGPEAHSIANQQVRRGLYPPIDDNAIRASKIIDGDLAMGIHHDSRMYAGHTGMINDHVGLRAPSDAFRLAGREINAGIARC